MEAMFVVPSIPGVHTVYVDASVVNGNSKPILIVDPQLTVQRFEEFVNAGNGTLEVDGVILASVDELNQTNTREAAA